MTHPTFTADQIAKMTPPQLRKAVTDLGGDPMKFDKGNPVELRKWLTTKMAAKKPAVAPTSKLTTKAATPPKPVARPAAKPAVKPVAAPAARPATPPKPVAKPAAKPAAAAPAQVAPKPAPAPTKGPATAAMMEDKSWREAIELRLATIEAQLGIAATVTGAAPVGDLSCLEQFLVLNEETGETDYEIDVSMVPTLTVEQLAACYTLLGKPLAANTPVRVMRNEVGAALQKLAVDTGVEEGSEAAEGGEAEAEAGEVAEETEGAVEYEVGNIVVATFGGEQFDPCRIEKVFRKRADGSLAGYDVFFPQDNTVARLDPADVLGLSDQTIE